MFYKVLEKICDENQQMVIIAVLFYEYKYLLNIYNMHLYVGVYVFKRHISIDKHG